MNIFQLTDPPNNICPVGNNITIEPLFTVGCGDVCVEHGYDVNRATLFCLSVTTRLPVDCVLRSPEGLTPNQLAEIDDGFKGYSHSIIDMVDLLANPEDPASPRILGGWTCTCNNSDGIITYILRLGPCRKFFVYNIDECD